MILPNLKKNKNNYVFCLKYQEEIIPFQQLSDQQFYMTSEKSVNDLLNLSILPNNSRKTNFQDINNINYNITNYDEEMPAINCNYVDTVVALS